jgi:5-formyltetrahydrofolate cyclo-ligase
MRHPQDVEPFLDLIVVPGVAFDASGARLGRGGCVPRVPHLPRPALNCSNRGYYDRFFKQSEAPQKGLRIALALDAQVLAEVPFDPSCDQRVDIVLTATRTLGPHAALML